MRRVVHILCVRLILHAAALLLATSSALAQSPGGAERSYVAADHWLAADKPVHLLGGYLAAGAGYAAGIQVDWSRDDRRLGAIAAGAAAGIVKELWDAGVQSEPLSWKDLTAGAAGILLFVSVAAVAE